MSEMAEVNQSLNNKEYSIEFASLSEISSIAEWDRELSSAQLLWKLQHNEIIIARNEAGIAGFIRLEYLWSKQPYIGLIRVKTEEQRQGIGRGMLIFLEKHLVARGKSKLYSSSQADEADPQRWHRHVGFKECGIINGINDGIGEMMFVKDLI